MAVNLKIKGYTVFILKCADGSFFSGMCEDLEKKLDIKDIGKSSYFSMRSDRFPVKVIYREDHVPFFEAFIKHKCLKNMKRDSRETFLKTGEWPDSQIIEDFLSRKYKKSRIFKPCKDKVRIDPERRKELQRYFRAIRKSHGTRH